MRAVLAVIAPPSVQVQRLVRSRGWTEAQAKARLAAQRDNDTFRAAADETLVNARNGGGAGRRGTCRVGETSLALGHDVATSLREPC
jgi:hypothetical protein